MREPMFQAVKNLEYSYLVDSVVKNMMRQHYHDGYEIYLQLNGERNIFFNHHKYILKRGSLFIIEPFVLHMTTSVEGMVCSRNIMNFKRDTLASFLPARELNTLCSELSSCIIQLDEERLEIIQEHFNEIDRKWQRFRHGREKRCENLAYIEIYRLIDRILCFKAELSEIIHLESVEIVTDPDIYRVLKFVEEHYAREITLDEMVEYSHMSKSSFYRAFKRITGDTFGNYLTRYRLSKAHKLIVETDISFKKIAERTGFSSTAHMSRTFRQRYGTSPSEFRKNENI